MGLISIGINKVVVLALSNGIWADGSDFVTPRTALVKWASTWSNKHYQVYVNGRFAGATVDSEQRQLLVQVPNLPERAVRIEVFAVDAGEADIDFGYELSTSDCQSGRIRISLLRGQNLPAGSTAMIYSDNGTGEVDYDSSVNVWPIEIWPAWQEKAGFGMSRFGLSDFGYDGAAATGFGLGNFGRGEFGFDADSLEWVSRPYDIGTYKFGVKIVDAEGNASSGSETGEISVVPSAVPAQGAEVDSFDKESNRLILNILQ